MPPLARDPRVWSLFAANLLAALIAQDQGTAIPSLVVLFWLQTNVGMAFGVVAMIARGDVPLPFRLGILAPFLLIFVGIQAGVIWGLPGEPKYFPLTQAWAALDRQAIAFAVTLFAIDGFAALRSSPPQAAKVLSPTHLLVRATMPALIELVYPMYLLAFLLLIGLGFVAQGASTASALWSFALIKAFFDIYVHRQILHSRRIAGIDVEPPRPPG